MAKQPVYIRTDFKNLFTELTEEQIDRLEKFVNELSDETDPEEEDV